MFFRQLGGFMNRELYTKLKEDLAEAVRSKNIQKIEEIKKILNISKEQEAYFSKGLTGYPSIDKVWIKYYHDTAFNEANDIPLNKTVWDVTEEKLEEYYDIPAIEYFNKQMSREDFRERVYTWAKTFKAMGVEPDEVVPIYGPFFPDVCAMVYALNMIGATSYFLKLAISPEALEEETRDSKIAVVFDGMWNNVKDEFSKDKFKKILVATVTEDMPSPKKEIVSFLNYIQTKKDKSGIPNDKKYIWLDEAKDLADYYTGNVKEKFVPNRSAFITSSSGTTVGGVVKGTVATNESTLTQLQMATASDVQYFPGDRCLNSLPPTASTSLNVLFFLAMYKGLTVLVDPRVSEKDFYNQIVNLKPNIALTTGSMWEAFFNRVYNEMKQGKKFDFSCAKGWTIGGEGTDVQKFDRWNEIMRKANATNELFSGYGLSELFSAISVDKLGVEHKARKQIMDVGIPYAGINIGIFDNEGKELSYNQRGELRVNSNSAMKEYYNKPELTQEIIVDDWVHTGDLAEIDEDGFLYIWGRVKDGIDLPNGEKLKLFDVANQIKDTDFIDDAIVLPMETEEENTLVAHIVWNEVVEEDSKASLLEYLDQNLQYFLPENVNIVGYSFHEGMLPYSPTTLKKDKNKLSKQTTGYVQIVDGNLVDISFIPKNGKYEIQQIEKGNNKQLIKK